MLKRHDFILGIPGQRAMNRQTNTHRIIIMRTETNSFYFTTYTYFFRALVDYESPDAAEWSFQTGDLLRVIDSYVITKPGQPYKWKAIKEGSDGTGGSPGYIPRQIRYTLNFNQRVWVFS